MQALRGLLYSEMILVTNIYYSDFLVLENHRVLLQRHKSSIKCIYIYYKSNQIVHSCLLKDPFFLGQQPLSAWNW